MLHGHPDRPGPNFARCALWRGAALAASLALAACPGRDEPRVTVHDLNWACGTTRCTASFRLQAGTQAESLQVFIRAYAGDRVADREIVGEHREHVALGSGQSRRLSVVVETRQPANRVRVVVQ